MARCASLKNVVGVKDATANVARVTSQRLACGEDFIHALGRGRAPRSASMAHGGVGCISVTSNVAPRLCAEFQGACLKGDWRKARELQDRLMPLHDSAVLRGEPGPGEVRRLPARPVLAGAAAAARQPIAEESRRKIDDALKQVGLARLAKAAE